MLWIGEEVGNGEGPGGYRRRSYRRRANGRHGTSNALAVMARLRFRGQLVTCARYVYEKAGCKSAGEA